MDNDPWVPKVKWRNAGIVVAAVFMVGSCIRSLAGSPEAVEAPPDRYDAVSACQHFIKKALHDPSSVEWVTPSTWPASKDAEVVGRWRVSATYRAKNGFGAMRLARAACVVDHERGGYWRLSTLTTA